MRLEIASRFFNLLIQIIPFPYKSKVIILDFLYYFGKIIGEISKNKGTIMRLKDAIQFYGSKANIKKVLGLSKGAVYRWGKIIPQSSAGRLYVLSGHKIPFREEDYQKGGVMKK